MGLIFSEGMTGYAQRPQIFIEIVSPLANRDYMVAMGLVIGESPIP